MAQAGLLGYVACLLMLLAGLRRLWVCLRTLPRCLRGDAHFGEAFAAFFPGADKQLHYEYAHYVYPPQMSRVLMHNSLNQGWMGIWCFVCCFFCVLPHRTAYLMCCFPYLYALSHFIAIDCAPDRDLSTSWSEFQIVIVSVALHLAFDLVASLIVTDILWQWGLATRLRS